MSHTPSALLPGILTIFLVSLLGCSSPGDGAALRASEPVAVSESPASSDSLTRLASAIDLAVETAMAAEHLPGVAVVVVRDGETIIKKGYGLANVEAGVAVDPDVTLFRIGSVSKALTALTVTRLADQGKISLDDDVARYYDDFDGIENVSGSLEPVRIRHLLTHTGGFDQIGIDRHIWQLDKSLTERKALRPDLQTFLADRNLRRVSPAGRHFRYDTYGITLAGAVLENVTGQPYAEAMQALLFEPLGMTRSFVEVPDTHARDLALGYGYVDGKYVEAPYEVYVTTAASSIDATPADMGRLLEALTGDGGNRQGRLFSVKMARAVLSPQFRPHPEFPGITHGLFENPRTEKGHPIRSVWHGGSMLGFLTSFTLLPDLKTGYFIVTNRDQEAGGGEITLHGQVGKAILDSIHEISQEPIWAVPPLDSSSDLTAYAGDYVYGLYCHTCTALEIERGGWQRGPVDSVKAVNGALKIRDQSYRPQREGGVFVREDGRQRVYFARDGNGDVSSFSYDSSPDVFEKID